MKALLRITPLLLLLPLALFLAACGNDDDDDANGITPTPGEQTPGNGTPTQPGSTPTMPSAVCLDGGGFVDNGPITVDGAAAEGDARQVIRMRWATHEVCERFVIDLMDEEGTEATTVGPVEAEFLRDLGVIRVTFGDEFDEHGPTNATTDIDPDGEFIDRAYSVLSLDGRRYVDVHLAAPSLARVLVLDSPARVVVDVHPGGPALPEPAPTGDLVVVLEPRDGDATYPLTITGYARTFEANVLVRLRADGDIAAEDNTMATGWVDTWGEFEITLDDGPTGDVELFVGELSAQDGEEQGVYIDLSLAGP